MNSSSIDHAAVAEVLNLAADDLDLNGWVSGPPGMAPEGPHCALGAIGAALQVRVSADGMYSYVACDESLAARALRNYLDLYEGDDDALWSWNDDQTSVEPVREALRAVAAIEQSKADAARHDAAQAVAQDAGAVAGA